MEINPNLSSTGTYTIEYSIAGGCTSSSSFTVLINEEDDSSFNYSSDSFCIGETSVATPTFTTLGGTFTASPTGLSFDVLTGVISANDLRALVRECITENGYEVPEDLREEND